MAGPRGPAAPRRRCGLRARRRVELAVSYQPVYGARVHTTEGALDALDWAWFVALRVDHSVLD